MVREQKGQFLILKKIKYGESDLILQALSPQGERVSFIARGALKSKKRFGGGVLEPSHHVQLVYRNSRSGEGLRPVLEASLLQDFQGVRRSYDHLEFALKVLECAYRIGQEGDANSESLYNLIGHVLKAIESASNLVAVKMQFYLKLLLQQGVLTLEPWMTPFLRAKISESESLISFTDVAEQRLPYVESIIENYMANAE